MDISIVIPAYNEEGRIITTLGRVHTYLKNRGLAFEIIVVDDGSKDNTGTVVEEFGREHPEVRLLSYGRNQGKGYAVKTGVLAAQGNLILFSDADLSTPIEELEKLEQAIAQGYDIAIGSRGLPDSRVRIKQSWQRRIMGILGAYLIKLIVIRKFADTQCGFKMFTGKSGILLFQSQKIPGFAFDIELLYKAVKADCRVKEVPVVWLNSAMSRVSIWRDPIRVLRDLFRIRLGI